MKGGQNLLFGKKKKETAVTPQLVSAQRSPTGNMVLPAAVEPYEKELYDRLRAVSVYCAGSIVAEIQVFGSSVDT